MVSGQLASSENAGNDEDFVAIWVFLTWEQGLGRVTLVDGVAAEVEVKINYFFAGVISGLEFSL